ncbi:MAG: hypothetical protein ABSF95_09240 [Verrucomicrobiota bacterium]|jgi:hypothetical protein
MSIRPPARLPRPFSVRTHKFVAQIPPLLRRAAWLAVCACLGGACQSPKAPGHESLAAVLISGQTPLTTARAVSDVFQKAGYTPVPLPPNKDTRLVFEKPGGALATVLYGDWEANKVWYRVKVRIDALGADLQLVTCDVFRVLDHGDAHFEQEQKVTPLKKGPYRHLLNQVKARAGGAGK